MQIPMTKYGAYIRLALYIVIAMGAAFGATYPPYTWHKTVAILLAGLVVCRSTIDTSWSDKDKPATPPAARATTPVTVILPPVASGGAATDFPVAQSIGPSSGPSASIGSSQG